MKREDLINEVLNQILQDAKDFDLTAIEELIKNIPDEALMAYLPEEAQGETSENQEIDLDGGLSAINE